MPPIKNLPPEVISKIAAGEVIERPASVLKELLENAADSGASRILIDLEKAGKQLIRVSDDGGGIPPQELKSALERHATSKISSFEDLDSLATFGFRGEALYSIGAVSRLSISSCSGGSAAQIVCEGGVITRQSEAAPAPGTTVEVRDLFFNVPARQKFLKSDPTERAHLFRAAEECALANPHIAVQLRCDGNEIFSLPAAKPGADAEAARIKALLGRDIADGLLFATAPPLGMKAYFSKPGSFTASRDLQFFFVNRRPVSCRVLQQALYRAYREYRQQGKHPTCVVYLTLKPADFDVNIHPQKKDVRFANEPVVFNLVRQTVEAAIAAAMTADATPVAEIAAETRTAPPPAQTQNIFSTEYLAPKTSEPLLSISDSKPAVRLEAQEAQSPRAVPLPSAMPHRTEQGWDGCRYLGQALNTYLLFEVPGKGLLLLDQHAAQERLFFDAYVAQLNTGTRPPVQKLLLPYAVHLPLSLAARLEQWQEWLSSAGFELDNLGPGQFAVHGVPALFNFDEDSARSLLESLASVLGDPEKCSEEVRRQTLAMMSCKKAIKSREKLSDAEAVRLFRDIQKAPVKTCPHGRPVLAVISPQELAKLFSRTKAA